MSKQHAVYFLGRVNQMELVSLEKFTQKGAPAIRFEHVSFTYRSAAPERVDPRELRAPEQPQFRAQRPASQAGPIAETPRA